jgi:short-subunit dehydrogenase
MDEWRNKVVVITGGSQGFGFELAVFFAQVKATVVITARDSGRLKSAIESANALGVRLNYQPIDVTSDDSVATGIRVIIERFGRIDVWVNNVGKSARTKVLECPMETYRDLMELNFFSAVRCTRAVLPYLEQTAGHLVSIGSLASKTGWPFVAPYATSKHALAAFHHQLRLEGPDQVNYLLVCPGPIARKDAGQRYAAQAQNLDSAAAQPGGGVKLRGIPPQKLAAKIESYCRRRKAELVVPGYSRILFAISQLFPGLGDWVLRRSRKGK